MLCVGLLPERTHPCDGSMQGGVLIGYKTMGGTAMIWGLVTFAKRHQWSKPLMQWRSQFFRYTGWVVNNWGEQATEVEIAGHNEQYEFGGYLTLLGKMEPLRGPYVLVNDTLFRTHHTQGWMKLLSKVPSGIECEDRVVYGDIRWDGTALAERPNPFLASWIFVLPNKASLQLFQSVLQEVLLEEPQEISAEYEAFLQQWLTGGSRWRGWHGRLDVDVLARKRACVVWEHRLSLRLMASGMTLRSLGEWDPSLYARLRLIDRIKTRWKAWMG